MGRSNHLCPMLLMLVVQLQSCSSFIITPSSVSISNKPSPSSCHASVTTTSEGEDEVSIISFQSERRRNFIQSALVAPCLTAVTTTLLTPQSALASDNKPPPIIPLITTAKRLRTVPLFAIVDGNGTPFHTYDKDSAGGFGYFFTSYTSAEYVLDDAKKAYEKAKLEAAQKKLEASSAGGTIGEDGTGEVPDTWGQAQIVTVPLDVAMQLSVKKTQSVAQNAKSKTFNTYYQVIPATEDLNAALRIDSGQRFKERGRVPLFFVDGLTLPSNEEGLDQVTPSYFRVKDLVAEWKKQYPDSELPKIQVRELNETFRSMITPGGRDKSVKDLVFVANVDSVAKAKGTLRNYKLGQMILTK